MRQLQIRHVVMPALVVLLGGLLSLGMKPAGPEGPLAAGSMPARFSPALEAPIEAPGGRALRPPLEPRSLATVAEAVHELGNEPDPEPEPEPAPEPAPEPEPEPEPEPQPEPESPPEPEGLLPRLDAEAVAAVASRTGVPTRAMHAYAGSAMRMQEERPGCHIDWALLAAIGYVESHHGTLSGGYIGEDGRTTQKVLGPPLNGTNETRAIRDTDGGQLDGDTTWDRAVGPMQFIPGTWQGWAVDADGDGVADPHDVDDAALAAARYLCASGGDLTSSEGWSRAVFAYNRSERYVRTVVQVNNHYAQASHG